MKDTDIYNSIAIRIKELEKENKRLNDYISFYEDLSKKQNKEIEGLKELCDKYEEEHKTTFKEWQDTIKRIDKAKKYIENNYPVCAGSELLDILKGDDKE